jgi:8-oxo-dGTP diphosphatase
VGAAIVDGARCLVAQRSAAMREPLRWEFPGGKVEPGESAQQALAREIDEELGVRIEVLELLGGNDHQQLRLDVYLARIVDGEPVAHEHAALRWVAAEGLDALDWAAADVPLVAPLRRYLTRPVV